MFVSSISNGRSNEDNFVSYSEIQKYLNEQRVMMTLAITGAGPSEKAGDLKMIKIPQTNNNYAIIAKKKKDFRIGLENLYGF